MPIDKYFKGKGSKVMEAMKKEYGGKKGKSVFYATANKEKLTPSNSGKKGIDVSPSKSVKKKTRLK